MAKKPVEITVRFNDMSDGKALMDREVLERITGAVTYAAGRFDEAEAFVDLHGIQSGNGSGCEVRVPIVNGEVIVKRQL